MLYSQFRSWGIALCGLVCLVLFAAAEPVYLVKDGKSAAAIVLSSGAGPAEQFAAKEFADHIFLQTGARLAVGNSAVPGLIPVRFQLQDVPEVQEDGFLVDVSPKEVKIGGKKLRSLYFGGFYLLKQYGGIRWLYPGDEGTYIPKRKDFSLPAGKIVKNPDLPDAFPLERGRFGVKTKLFLARNMQVFGTRKYDPVYAMPCLLGGHEMTRLLVGHIGVHFKDEKEFDAARTKLLAEHPECFGLRDGKRVTSGNWLPRTVVRSQPCTANPETVRRMAANMIDRINALKDGDEIIYQIANDDHLNWCQCPLCQKADGSGKKTLNNLNSNRWWSFANALTQEFYRQYKGKKKVTLNFMAYQNFTTPPDHGKMDNRYTVQYCPHGRCYLHPLAGKGACSVNTVPGKMLTDIARACRVSTTFEYPEQLPGSYHHLFREKSWIRDLQLYHKLGIRGFGTNFYSADTNYRRGKGHLQKKAELIEQKPYAEFLFWALSMHFVWNIHDDIERVTEELESVYYGGAYPAMKEYRRYMENAALRSGVHMSTKLRSFALIGECLVRSGGVEKPQQLLREAARLAAPDPILARRIAVEQKIFDDEWLAAYNFYKNMDGKPEHAQRRSGKIVIDGKLTETDWQSARPITDFRLSSGPKDPFGAEARIVFDDNNIYFGFRAKKGKNGLSVDKLGPGTKVFQGSHVQLFLTPSGPEGPYYLLGFAPGNHLFQSRFSGYKGKRDDSIQLDPEFRTLETEDAWCVEARIPLAPMKAKLQNGSTWKLNVVNQLLNDQNILQYSSCCGGNAHGSAGHLNLIFGEVVPLIRNGGFETATDGSAEKKWHITGGKVPSLWLLASKNCGSLELRDDPEKPGNHYLHIKGDRSYLSQRFIPKKHQKPKLETYRVEGRVRGKGELRVSILGSRKQNMAPNSTIRVDTGSWQNFSVVIECIANALYLRVTGELDLDDIRVSPCTGQANAEIDAF